MIYFTGSQQSMAANRYLVERIDDIEHCGTLQGVGQESCRQNPDGSHVWAMGDYQTGTYDSSGYLSGDYTNYRVMGGYDRRFGISTVGLAGGYGKGDANAVGYGSSENQFLYVGGYVSNNVRYVNLDLAAGYTRSWGSTSREVDAISGFALGESYAADQASSAITADARITQEYQSESGWEIQPQLGVNYYRMSAPGVVEAQTGTNNVFGLTVDDMEHSQLDGYGGLELRRAFKGGSTTIIPEGRLTASRILSGQTLVIPTKFSRSTLDGYNDSEFTLPVNKLSVGGGVNMEMSSGLMAYGDYDFTFGDGVTDHKLRGGIRMTF